MTFVKYMAWKFGIIIAAIALMIGIPSLIHLITVVFGIDESKDVTFLVLMSSLILDFGVSICTCDILIELKQEYEIGRLQRRC